MPRLGPDSSLIPPLAPQDPWTVAPKSHLEVSSSGIIGNLLRRSAPEEGPRSSPEKSQLATPQDEVRLRRSPYLRAAITVTLICPPLLEIQPRYECRAAVVIGVVVWSASLAWLVGTSLLACFQPKLRALKKGDFTGRPVSVIVPTSSVHSPRASRERSDTLRSLTEVRYPQYEIIVAVDRSGPGCEIQLDRTRAVGGRGINTVYANTQTPNAKVDAMQAGLQAAEHELLLFCDDDVKVHREHLQHLVSLSTGNTRLVSAAAFGTCPENLWGHLECAFMNGQFARLHLAGDCIGYSGALGKTVLIRKRDLENAGGLLSAGDDCCEDAALSRNVKKAGGRVILSGLPVRQFIGRQRLVDVLRRHRRWLSCRRKYLPLVFTAEAAFSTVVAMVAGAYAAGDFDLNPAVGMFGTLALWCAVDTAFAAWHGYLTAMTPVGWLLREIVFIPLWLSALSARTVKWYGRRVPV